MYNTNRIYTVYGQNNDGTICFESNTLDVELAGTWFNELCKCEDVDFCHIADATTGEIIAYYLSYQGNENDENRLVW